MIKGVPKPLGSLWEISENGDRGYTQNFAADIASMMVWPGDPLSKNVEISRTARFSNLGISNSLRNCQFSEIRPCRVQQDMKELLRIQREAYRNL